MRKSTEMTLRFQPNYKPVVKWRQILTKGALATGASRKKAWRWPANWLSICGACALAAAKRKLSVLRFSCSKGTEKGEHAEKEIKTTLEHGSCPLPNLLRTLFACVGLDWARPCSSSINRIDQIVP
jgi:hypothetical protein